MSSGDKQIFKAVREGDLRSIKKLVQEGTDVNENDSRGFAPLFYAAYTGNLEVVSLLLSLGSNLEASDETFGYTAIFPATYHGFTEIVEVLKLEHKLTQKTELDILR